MKVFDAKHIKNIVLLGSHGCGKTTLAETMLFEAGLIQRRGRVEDKNTTSDHHDLEHERGSSVYSTVLHTEWRNFKINIIDTPGLDDLVGETMPALRVADTCVLLLNAQHGVEVGTDLIWERMLHFERPVIIGVNQLDHPNADFDGTVAQAKEHFGSAVTVMQYPVEQGDGFHRIIDLLKMTMYVFKDAGGKPEKQPIPDAEKERAEALHKELVEKAAENDETLMEHYFDKGELTEDEMRIGLKQGMMKRTCFPVFCLSALRNMGSGRLMGFIDNVAPCALEMPAEPLVDGETLACTVDGPTVLFTFKTTIEPRAGHITLFKVMSGEVKEGMDLVNDNNGSTERINQLFIVDGKERKQVERLVAGDIGGTIKLKHTSTAHTLHTPGSAIKLQPIPFPEPHLRLTIKATDQKQEEKLHAALLEIQKEDPTITLTYSRETAEQIIGGQGELHLDLLKWKLNHHYKVDAVFGSPRIPYRETIRKPAEASYRHKKQSGGSGQFGEVHLKIEPWYEGMPEPTGHSIRGKELHELPTGGILAFYNCIVGGVIDNKFMPSILKGILGKMDKGPLTGSPARDIRVIVYDGKMHPVDSNDISFKIAGLMAFKEAFMHASPQLMEPVQEIEVRVPADLLGDVMTDLQGRRSVVLGIEAQGRYQIIKAHTPSAELDRYSTTLRSLTQGRGTYSARFHQYAAVSSDLQNKLLQDHKEEEVTA
ncbi:MAG: elongation factor G [Flavobacteriales bacterium]|jgi:elongation factor G|nr:elongation factor G [Flavobacteriales bacterium]MBK6883838.1 elongation factor G [Flavobacteriales bacterium]MBK7100230.1 elongation factor G [Flavobacteriales bacterium]MBK7110923.1 elongation factor G [Flavobacteriales bacterium]MBK7481336.1 elongation factor G [Flavobacteriales bacterium]